MQRPPKAPGFHHASLVLSRVKRDGARMACKAGKTPSSGLKPIEPMEQAPGVMQKTGAKPSRSGVVMGVGVAESAAVGLR